MKYLFLFIFQLLLVNVFASEIRSYEKISPNEARVTIRLNDKEPVQADLFIDQRENNRFVNEMLNDPKSELFKIRRQVEMRFCNKMRPDQLILMENCGKVTLTPQVMTAFSKDGWESAYSSQSFFLGFTSEGAGRYFEVQYLVTFQESVFALIDQRGLFTGSFHKKLKWTKAVPINDETPLY